LASNGNLKQENPRDPSFAQIEGTNYWLQGMDANQAWKRSYVLARHVRVDLRVAFIWRQNPNAARPGESGLLEWSPGR